MTGQPDSESGNSALRVEDESEINSFESYHSRLLSGVVVSCNHHDAILKYIKESDFRFDSPNTIFFLKSALEIAESVRRGTEVLPTTIHLSRAQRSMRKRTFDF